MTSVDIGRIFSGQIGHVPDIHRYVKLNDCLNKLAGKTGPFAKKFKEKAWHCEA